MKTKIVTLFVLYTIALPSFGVNIKEAVPIGGINQWITVSGQPQKPLLLFLHGGPGNSVMSYAHRFTDQLGKKFLIVHWDQRESGRTAELNPSDQPLTVSLAMSDAIEIIQYLKKRFDKDKIYLMGQSWGGFLALQVAIAQPELLEACFAVSPMINQLESERMSLTRMIELSKRKNDTAAIKELERVKIPFNSVDDIYLHRKWLAVFDGRTPSAYPFVEAWCKIWLPLFVEGSHQDIAKQAPEIKCPVYFFVGRNDYQTHFQLTENYYQQLKTEKKNLFWYENSSHSPHLKESKKFQDDVLSTLKSK